MQSVVTFVKSVDRLRWIKPMFNHLKNVIDEYVSWEKEPPYWNNENASVSMLVGAGARGGYIALSDYRTDKRNEAGAVRGRCDFLIGKGQNWLEIEAKPTSVWLPSRPEEDSAGRIDEVVKAAEGNAKCIVSRHPNRRAGLVFAMLDLPVPRNGREPGTFRWPTPKDDIRKLKELFKKVDSDICWMWWDEAADHKYRWQGETRFHPGIAVLIKLCRG